jgi:hypothetical protein
MANSLHPSRKATPVISTTLQQKVAWFNLAVFAAAVLAYVALVPVLGAVPALGAFGICGLWGFSACSIAGGKARW